jgi:hypothetical protein
MSPKSKYNRRNISQNKAESGIPAAPASIPSTQTVTSRNMRSPSTAEANAKAVLDMTSSSTFLSDVKWIGIVTIIILVLLVAAYFLFH